MSFNRTDSFDRESQLTAGERTVRKTGCDDSRGELAARALGLLPGEGWPLSRDSGALLLMRRAQLPKRSFVSTRAQHA
jgi:hypothetical protein